MRIFIDTNVWLEYLCGRSKATDVRDLLDLMEDGAHEAFLSSASFCTISYYVGLAFKDAGVHKPEKTSKTREVLNLVLSMASVTDIDHQRAHKATNDTAFSDFEDSLQYQCALKAECDLFVTLNIKDFKNAETKSIQILTPRQAYECLALQK